MMAWEVLELTVLESAPGASLSLALLVHALQVALILTATAIALCAGQVGILLPGLRLVFL